MICTNIQRTKIALKTAGGETTFIRFGHQLTLMIGSNDYWYPVAYQTKKKANQYTANTRVYLKAGSR